MISTNKTCVSGHLTIDSRWTLIIVKQSFKIVLLAHVNSLLHYKTRGGKYLD